MAWKIEFTKSALKQLSKLDKSVADRVVTWLEDRILPTHNPRLWGGPLHGNHGDKWRYRVGNYRILCEIADSVLLVRVVELGHRRKIYR